jgi:hypothetical protein
MGALDFLLFVGRKPLGHMPLLKHMASKSPESEMGKACSRFPRVDGLVDHEPFAPNEVSTVLTRCRRGRVPLPCTEFCGKHAASRALTNICAIS